METGRRWKCPTKKNQYVRGSWLLPSILDIFISATSSSASLLLGQCQCLTTVSLTFLFTVTATLLLQIMRDNLLLPACTNLMFEELINCDVNLQRKPLTFTPTSIQDGCVVNNQLSVCFELLEAFILSFRQVLKQRRTGCEINANGRKISPEERDKK